MWEEKWDWVGQVIPRRGTKGGIGATRRKKDKA